MSNPTQSPARALPRNSQCPPAALGFMLVGMMTLIGFTMMMFAAVVV